MEVPEPRVRKRPLSKMAFSSLSVGWLVGGLARGLHLAKHLLPLFYTKTLFLVLLGIFFRKSLADFLLRGVGGTPPFC